MPTLHVNLRVTGTENDYERNFPPTEVASDKLAIIEDMLQGASSTRKVYYAVHVHAVHGENFGVNFLRTKTVEDNKGFIRGCIESEQSDMHQIWHSATTGFRRAQKFAMKVETAIGKEVSDLFIKVLIS